jgi:hypothetical protein
MAEIVIKSAYVQAWKRDTTEPNPDWAMKIAEPHYKKNGEEYFVAGRTYYTVKAAYGQSINFTGFHEGDKVTIVGKMTTESREYDGKTYNTLTIAATSVEIVADQTRSGNSRQLAAWDETF